MIKILRASAGSGKTYNLAETYIRLLLSNDDPSAYRHILAVTFTNKATDEMKRRILKELHILSVNPDKSPYKDDFIPSMFTSADALKRKSGDILIRILHDYGAFAVSTIDRFFQQTLKAFSREIGQFASYQVELDKNSLVAETVERILDGLTEDDKALLNWLSDNMMDQLEQGKRPNLVKNLTDKAQRLKSEQHRTVVEENGIDEDKAYSKESLDALRKRFRHFMAEFIQGLKEAAAEVNKAFSDNGLSTFDTKSKWLGNFLAKIDGLQPRADIPVPSDSVRNKASDFSEWFKKDDQKAYAHLEGSLLPSFAKLIAYYDQGYKAYNTAKILIGQIGDLGIASELQKEFQNLLKEKNVLSLDDSNVILKNIIDGSDAPFIYEKLGVRFEHFLLDEFQDTSRVQWDNFKPLIANSDSEGFENLLVGDVKQSIYRFRDSDWKLMAVDVAREFPRATEDSLKGNWRSLENLVEFNNEFFAYAAERLDKAYGNEDKGISVSMIYGKKDDGTFDKQIVKSKDDEKGFVEAIFCPKDDQKEHILKTIQKIIEAGALPGDITVLVRKNTEGSDVAAFLMENGYDVISDDSLRLKSSLIVRKLVSLLSSVKNPDDTLGSFLAKEAGLDVGDLSFHSLVDLCERLARLLAEGPDKEVFKSETLYIQSFMDYVMDHVAINGNSLDSFLKAWDEADPKVSSPADVQAIRIMTIHKSKGLEFPYVIFPYAETIGLFKDDFSWNVPNVEGTPLEGMEKTAFDVNLSSKSRGTLFEDSYREELFLQYIDNINSLYVALTRASKGMTIISDSGTSANKSLAGILKEYLESDNLPTGFAEEPDSDERTSIFTRGQMYDFTKMEREESGFGKREPGYPSFPLDSTDTDEDNPTQERGRLRLSPDAALFFTDEGAAIEEARHNGTVLHDILSRVRVPSDLEDSVLQAVRSGDLEGSRRKEVTDLLSDRIAAHPEWFPTEGAEIFNEVSLIDTDGKEWRPDRVVVKDGSVTVIDYKFGEKESRYKAQVNRYAGIYRRLGYQNVSTAIWYVPSDVVD